MKTKNFTRFLIWESIIVLGLLILIGSGIMVSAGLSSNDQQQAVALLQVETTPTQTTAPTPSPTPTTPPTSVPSGAIVPVASTGGNTMGWVESDQTAAEVGQSYLYLLLRDGTVFHGPMQFDQAVVPSGSTVIMAEVVNEQSEENGTFVLNILPAPNSDASTGSPANQVIFSTGEQVAVQDRLQESSLLSFSLTDLFPGGSFEQVPEGLRQETIVLSSNPPIEKVEGMPTPTATFVVITSTPLPENIVTAAAVAATVTAQAVTTGTPTPLPPNWVTPWIVTSTPTPANKATAEFHQLEATAAAQLYGPRSPAANMVTATPKPTAISQPTETATPVFIMLEGELPPVTITPVAAFEPIPPIPDQLIGKIAFKSDRSGREEIYVVNPDGSGLALLTNRWPYNLAVLADSFSADGRFRVFTKDTSRYQNVDGFYTNGFLSRRDEVPSLYWYDSLYRVEEQLTHFGAGIAYQGVWSPTADQIAFVSNDSADDEIWVVHRDGSGLLQLTESNQEFNAREIGKDTFIPEVNRHPSWSPDGRQLVFWSTRTGNRQIFVMDADGNNLYSLSRTNFNDWDPVWIKSPGLSANALAAHMPYTGRFDPLGEDRDCYDFATLAESQTFYLAAGGPYRDPHKLDRDNDGIACN